MELDFNEYPGKDREDECGFRFIETALDEECRKKTWRVVKIPPSDIGSFWNITLAKWLGLMSESDLEKLKEKNERNSELGEGSY